MIPPTFQIGDEVLITGPSEYGNIEYIGGKFEIEAYHTDSPPFGGRDLYSSRGFPWYPASSLQLVEPELKIGDWVKTISGTIFRIGDIYPFVDGSASVWVSKDGGVQYPSHCLRKLTPDEIAKYQASQMLPKSTEIQELRRRIHDLEMSLNGFTNGPEPEHVPGISYVKDPIGDRLSAIEKRLDFVEKFQREQAEYRRGMLWMAGP